MDDTPDPPTCPICGNDVEWVECWDCGGAGAFHDCGEDCCPCLDPDDDLNDPCDVCDVCDGEGGYLECVAVPHSVEQMESYLTKGPQS